MRDSIPVGEGFRRKYARSLDAVYADDGCITPFTVSDRGRRESFRCRGFHTFVCYNMSRKEYPALDLLILYSKCDVQEKRSAT